MKKALSTLIVLLLVLVTVVSCSKKQDSKDSLEAIKAKGTFILGLDDSFPPMGYRDENNDIVGFDIDVAKEVTKRMGVELVLQPINWDVKELELTSGAIDCIWNGFTVTPEREEKLLFSRPYLKNRQVFIVRKGSNIRTLSDLQNRKIGVQSGSSGESAFEESSIYNADNVVGYPNFLMAILDLNVGGVDAVVIDEIVADAQLEKSSVANNLEVLRNLSLASEDYAIGFRKGDVELRDKVQEIIDEMKKDGTLKDIAIAWFGEDLTNL